MKRQSLTDSGGRWIDLDTATAYGEATYHDGSNHISRATGTQWDHETLYRSHTGQWVLHHWSQRQGSGESWVKLDHTDAARWLIANEHEHEHEELGEQIAQLEV